MQHKKQYNVKNRYQLVLFSAESQRWLLPNITHCFDDH